MMSSAAGLHLSGTARVNIRVRGYVRHAWDEQRSTLSTDERSAYPTV